MERNNLKLIYPVWGGGITTSKFGFRTHPISKKKSFHYGTDICPKDSNVSSNPGILSVLDGRIIEIRDDKDKGFGIWVLQKADIKDFDLYIIYAHLQKTIALEVGKYRPEGSVIGMMGNSGSSTNTHLHIQGMIGDARMENYHKNAFDLEPYFVDWQLANESTGRLINV